MISEKDEKKLSEQAEEILKGKESLLSKYPLTAMEIFEGKTIPELGQKYKKIMKEYEGVEKETKTPESEKWKAKAWDNLTLKIKEDYMFANDIKPSDKKEAKAAFEEHKRVLKELGYYGKPLKGKHFEDGSNEIPNEGKKVIERT